MWRRSEITLIREIPAAHGVGVPVKVRKHTESCTVKSIGQQEFYQAMATGLKPEVKIVLDWPENYCGEKRCRFEGKNYEILRTYESETNEIELTLYPEAGIARGEAEPDAAGV